MLKVRAAGVGLTLLNMRNGSFGGEAPRIMGHELGGDIVEVGSDVTELKVGDRCAVYFYLTCHRCRWCRGGRETLCEAFKGFVGVHRDGGYAEYVSLPVENFLHIPTGLSYEAAAMATEPSNEVTARRKASTVSPQSRWCAVTNAGITLASVVI
mgnify:CR=1 FL=1